MTNEKVVLPKEVADAIEQLRNEGTPDEYILTVTADPNDEWCQKDSEPLNDVDLMTLAFALVNGYRVEQTPHERLRKVYGEYSELVGKFGEQYDVGFTSGIYKTLEILDVEVEGINAFTTKF